MSCNLSVEGTQPHQCGFFDSSSTHHPHLLHLGPINHHTISSPNLVHLQVAKTIHQNKPFKSPFSLPLYNQPHSSQQNNHTDKYEFLIHVSDPILPSFQRKWLSRNASLRSSCSGWCVFLGNNNIIVIFGVSWFYCCRSRGFGFVQRGSEEAVGEVRGRDKGLDEERSEGLVGNLRHCRGCCSGLRPGGVGHARLHGSAELPSWVCSAIASEDGVWFWPRVFARSGVEEETLHK